MQLYFGYHVPAVMSSASVMKPSPSDQSSSFFPSTFVRMTGTSICARASMPFFFSAFIFILINSISTHFSSAKSPPEDLIRSLRSSSSPLILPLVLSTNSSPPSMEGNFQRQLQKEMHRSENAHMRLYDDLLTNGYYTTRIFIGNPPQEFALIVDSGSTVTYVPCSTCEQCGKHQG